jgi:hypothetical protein
MILNNLNGCFKEFKQQSIIIHHQAETIIKYGNWRFDYGFYWTPLPEHLWRLEPLLSKIDKEFAIKTCMIIRQPPNTLYNWHTDTERGLTINMKLCNNNDTHALFAFPLDDWSEEFVELKYQPTKMYLFNTQHRHCVINFSETRYVFTLKFKKEKEELDYFTVYNWCNQNQLFV